MTKENQEKQNGRTEGGSGKNANRRNNDRRKNNTSFTVSYTHLTLPTILLV